MQIENTSLKLFQLVSCYTRKISNTKFLISPAGRYLPKKLVMGSSTVHKSVCNHCGCVTNANTHGILQKKNFRFKTC